MKQFQLEKHTGALAPRIKYPDDVVDNGVLTVDGSQYWGYAQLDARNGIVFGHYAGPSQLDDYSPTVVTEPKPLTKRQFVALCQSNGGMTDSLLVQCKNDPNYAALWIKLELAGEVELDDPDTKPGLAAIEAGGYLPNGTQAVVDAWPRS